MSNARYLVGDVFAQLATIGDGTVDLVCTSPPFWRQRAYLPADHPDKGKEIGQEATPGEFIDMLLRLTAEFRRVLAPHGSIAVELGDTMAGSGGAGGDYSQGGFRDGQPKWEGSAKFAKVVPDGRGPAIPSRNGKAQPSGPGCPEAKSHCLIPEAYRLALAYGHNPLTGQPSPAGRWIVRNVVDWCRLNPTPGDDGDKFRRASSDIVIATLNPKRWWDGEAVREASAKGDIGRTNGGAYMAKGNPDRGDAGASYFGSDGTRPLYDWWSLASDPYPGAHYAVWPPEIARRLILAMCPIRVCTVCGEPSRRIVEAVNVANRNTNGPKNVGRAHETPTGNFTARTDSIRETVGWTDCGHDDWRRGHVLDPFGGSGTTAAAATGNGRDCTLIDLDERNVDLARERVGLFLEAPQ